MRRTLFSKTVSLVLLPAMLLSIASCGKRSSGKAARKIAPEDPWFDAKIYNIEPDLDTGGKEIDYSTRKLAGADDKYIVVFSQGSYLLPDNNREYTNSDYRYFLATVIDRNTGETINTINLNQYISGNGYIMDVEYINGMITSTVYKETESGSSVSEIDNDVLTGKKLDERDLGSSYAGFGSKTRIQSGKYTILAENAFEPATTETYFSLDIYSPQGKECNVKIKKERKDLNSTSIILPLDEDKLLVPFTQTADNVPAFFEVDVKTAKAVEVDGKDYDWIDFKSIKNVFGSKDGTAYFTTSVGISKIDMKNKKIEDFFSYNACPVNKELLGSTEVVDCSDNNIVLIDGPYSHSPYYLDESSSAGFSIYDIKKASVNPNAGKTVLELYATNGYVDQTVAEAIIRFNETNKDYFIEVTGRYMSDSVYTFQPTDSEDDFESLDLQNNMSLNDKLAMDIMNGTGPDILVFTDDMGRLNNSNNLADLSKYLGELDQEKYFTNVINAAKTDGKLYQLPVSFGIKGILTDEKYAGASGLGFTTKEYEEFLYGPLNGYDLDQAGQAFYFATLFNAMSDKFIVNGKVDFSGPEFAELAEFVKNNVHEKAPTMDSDEMTLEKRFQNDGTARLEKYASIVMYLSAVNEMKGSRAILGIPSSDGRGPMLTTSLSVAVSAQAVNVEACAEFAKILLSDEIQTRLAVSDRFTVNREVYKKNESRVLDYCNGPRANQEFGINHRTFEPVKTRIKFTADDLDYLENIILSCTHFDSADSSINIILIEEMPPYFVGQKDLNSVIKIAQDRTQKVLDERG